MLCPKCAERSEFNDTIILETRRYGGKKPANSWVTRRRRCVACLHRFSTTEVIKGADEKVWDAALRKDMAWHWLTFKQRFWSTYQNARHPLHPRMFNCKPRSTDPPQFTHCIFWQRRATSKASLASSTVAKSISLSSSPWNPYQKIQWTDRTNLQRHESHLIQKPSTIHLIWGHHDSKIRGLAS